MKNKKTRRIFFALGIILVLCIAIRGCYSKKKLDSPNPTSYIFDANIEQVRIAIVNNEDKYKKNKKMCLWSESEDKDIISHTDIKEDAWLIQFNDFLRHRAKY